MSQPRVSWERRLSFMCCRPPDDTACKAASVRAAKIVSQYGLSWLAPLCGMLLKSHLQLTCVMQSIAPSLVHVLTGWGQSCLVRELIVLFCHLQSVCGTLFLLSGNAIAEVL